jgi:hypothetical protein
MVTLLGTRPHREPNKIIEGHVPIMGDNQSPRLKPLVPNTSTNGQHGDGRVLPRVLLDDGQGKSPSDMDISSSDNSTTTARGVHIPEPGGTTPNLLCPLVITATGRIATGATTPARKQNKALRTNTLLAQPLGTQWTVHTGKTLLSEGHWNTRNNAAKCREMSPQGLALRHEAAGILTDWAQFGCPTCTGQDWSSAEIEAAISRGPHKSSLEPEALAHFAEEVNNKVNNGQACVVLWDDIRLNHPRQLKVSPVAAILHKSRAY